MRVLAKLLVVATFAAGLVVVVETASPDPAAAAQGRCASGEIQTQVISDKYYVCVPGDGSVKVCPAGQVPTNQFEYKYGIIGYKWQTYWIMRPAGECRAPRTNLWDDLYDLFSPFMPVACHENVTQVVAVVGRVAHSRGVYPAVWGAFAWGNVCFVWATA